MVPTPSFFTPNGQEKNLLRERWGVPRNKKVVLFAGTARPPNGLSNLVPALNIIDPNSEIGLLIVGGEIEGSIDAD